jgi:hypothetical protein
VGGDIVGRGQAGSPGSDGASPYPSFALPAPKASRVNPVNLPYKLALIGTCPHPQMRIEKENIDTN